MWKQWTNLILGIAVAVMAYYGVAVGWMIGAGALIALVALWAALEASPENARSMAHAH